MEITVLEPIVDGPVYRNEFVLTATAGYGDGNSENGVFVGRFINDAQDREKLKEYIRLCEAMVAAYPQGRGGHDSYSIVPGYDELLQDLWVGDPATDYEIDADFVDYEVVYYNHDGIKHAVALTGK